MRSVGIISAALLAIGAAGKEAEMDWYFDKDKTGEIAKGFSNEVGDWRVMADETAPSKPNVLAQLAKNSGSTFNITLIKDTSYKDLRLSVWLKAIAGSEDQGGGVVWRAKDAKNYYIARWNPLEDNFRVYKVVEERRRRIAQAAGLGVARDADDHQRPKLLARRLLPEGAAERLLSRPERARRGLIDDDGVLRTLAIAIVEVPAPHERHAQRGEVPGLDDVPLDLW